MNNLSRNAPIALIAGVGGMLGVNLTGKILEKNIQVIGVDNFSSSNKEFLDNFVKNRAFHLIEKGVEDLMQNDLPEVDYAYFLIDEEISTQEYENAFLNFLKLINPKKTKIVLVSSLDLYNPNITRHKNLKWAEEVLAKQTQGNRLNARIVRVSDIYGPGMDLTFDEPLFKLINLILSGNLSDYAIGLDVLTRAVFVSDIVNLLLKVVFHGSTSNKIYDGSLLYPIKLSEVKQALLDPVWYEKSGFSPSKLAAWPSPNLIKTQNELNWQPSTPILEGLRETVGFFNKYPQFKQKKVLMVKETESLINPEPRKLQKLNLPTYQPAVAEPKVEVKQIKAIKPSNFWQEQPKLKAQTKRIPKLGLIITYAIGLFLIGYGLIYPLTNILLAGFSLREDLNQASHQALVGNLSQAAMFINLANKRLFWLTQVYNDLLLVRPEGVLKNEFTALDNLKLVLTRSVAATDNFLVGVNALDQSINIIKGEGSGDLNNSFMVSQTNLADAGRNFQLVYALLNDPSFIDSQPVMLRAKLRELKDQSFNYSKQAEQLAQVNLLASQILLSDQEKNYLVVLEDNRVLRPSGGVVISTLEIKVKDGKITNLLTNNASDIDSKLGVGLLAPNNIKSDLGEKGLLLSNVTLLPDFIDSAKWMGLIYEKGTGEKIDGVITLDLTAVKEILGPSDSLNLGSNVEVNSTNLDQIVSQSNSSVVSQQILKELVNKLIFIPTPNWSNLISVITKAVEQKHIAVFMSDQAVFSVTSNFNWTPTLNYNPTNQAGEKEEYLYFYQTDSNLDLKSFNLVNSATLDSLIDNSGQVSHKFNLNYKSSATQKNPAKFKLTVEVPRGSKVKSVKWGSDDILKQGTSTINQNLIVYSFNLELNSDTKQFSLEYQDLLASKFDTNNNLKYNLQVIKQLGSQPLPFTYNLSFPANYKIIGQSNLTLDKGQLTSQIQLDQDQNYQVIFSNK